MKKKISWLILCLLVIGAVVGLAFKYLNQPSAPKHHKHEVAQKIVWDNRQALVLDEYIKNWGKTFKPQRRFIRYFPGVAGSNYLGYNYPQDLDKNNIIYQHRRIKLGVSKDGIDRYAYNVVAIYSDATDATVTNSSRLYLFTIHQQKPLILVTTTPKHARKGMLYVKESTSKSLTTIFTQLFTANQVTIAKLAPDNQWPTITYRKDKLDYRQIGAMVEAYFSLSDTPLTKIAQEENFSIRHVKNGPLKVGYYNLSPKLTYTYDKDSVVMTSNDLTTPNATIKMADLVAATYKTRAQKNDIDRAARLINLRPNK